MDVSGGIVQAIHLDGFLVSILRSLSPFNETRRKGALRQVLRRSFWKRFSVPYRCTFLPQYIYMSLALVVQRNQVPENRAASLVSAGIQVWRSRTGAPDSAAYNFCSQPYCFANHGLVTFGTSLEMPDPACFWG